MSTGWFIRTTDHIYPEIIAEIHSHDGQQAVLLIPVSKLISSKRTAGSDGGES